jgi:hypothetical protein
LEAEERAAEEGTVTEGAVAEGAVAEEAEVVVGTASGAGKSRPARFPAALP